MALTIFFEINLNMEYTLIDNEAAKRYEFEIDDHRPRVEYIKVKGKIYLTHTEVPKELEGKGVASQLIRKVLEEVEKHEWELVPLCPFVAMYIKRHPEWKKLVLKGINIE